jgi:hypothetical protein
VSFLAATAANVGVKEVVDAMVAAVHDSLSFEAGQVSFYSVI